MYFPNAAMQSFDDVYRELMELGRELEAAHIIPLTTKAPDKPRQGILLVADGSVWNPVGTGVPTVVTYLSGQWVILGTSAQATDDLRFPAQSFNPPGVASDPDYDTTNGLWLFAETGTEVIFGIAQFSHAWAEGTPVTPHCHWWKTTSAGGDVMWEFAYKWSSIGEVADSDFTVLTTNTTTDGTQDQDTAQQQLITSFGEVDTTGRQISDSLIFRFSRLGSDAGDTYGADAALLEVDIHYWINTPGSWQEFVKNA